VGEAKGPNVMTGYEDGATNCIVDSFLRSICLQTKQMIPKHINITA